MNNQEQFNPEKDLQIEGKKLADFLSNLPPRYLREEVSLPQDLMDRTATTLTEAGKKEFQKYGPVSAIRKERIGIGTIVIDCSKIKPQEKFSQVAEENKLPKGDDDIGSYELYAEFAYTMAVAVEAYNQMLELTAKKPRLRPENKQLRYDLSSTRDRIVNLGRVSSDVAGSKYSYVCLDLEQLAEACGMQKFVLVLTNTHLMPAYAKKRLHNMFNRQHGEHHTSVMFLAKEKTSLDVDDMVTVLKERLKRGQEGELQYRSNNLVKALDWYVSSRSLKDEIKKFVVDSQPKSKKLKEMKKRLKNQVDVIIEKGYNFFELDEELQRFSDEEIKEIQQKLFVF
ncbi:MAG: hypothetical protein IT416_02630 [Candidatus Pacebacteria bacterium]|nr:hypothetical protein [Candidatus Paceibacterota bacterium]